MTLRARYLALILAVLFLAAGIAAAQTSAPPDLDAWVNRSLKEFQVPGMALAIIKDGKVVTAKGYGVRKLGGPQAVDAHTLFGIASNSKAFTAAALAILVDEGKLSWDDPVIQHLPWFQLYDPYVTRELRIRDLLCHRSGLGLGAGDLLYWPEGETARNDVVRAARWIRPASSLRTKYAYSNLMFVVAGQVIEAVSGKSWDDFVWERILVPVGMAETGTNGMSLEATADVAWPHSLGWDQQQPLAALPLTRDYAWAAAAGIKSNVTDLAKWVTVQLNGGKIDDNHRLFSEAANKEMWTPQTIVPISEPAASLKATKAKFAAYGLGWSLRDYQGRKMVSHGGALTGMVSTVAMIPEEHLGVVLLTNQEVSAAYSAVLYHIFDYYLHLPETDWIAAYQASRQESRAKTAAEDAKKTAGRVTGTKPSLELAKYAGEYRDAWYGKASVALENGKLVLHMSRSPEMSGEMEHWNYDTFKVRFHDRDIPDALVTFALDQKGAIAQMNMVAFSGLADFSFDYHDLLFTPAQE